MKIVSILILFTIYGQIKSGPEDISERPFTYDGPFRRYFDFSFLLEKDQNGNIIAQDPIKNQLVTEPQCKLIEEGSVELSHVKLSGFEQMPSITCHNKKDILQPTLFECKNLDKKYIKKDKFDSPQFKAYVSPQKEVTKLTDQARFILKSMDMMAGYPLPWQCIKNEDLEKDATESNPIKAQLIKSSPKIVEQLEKEKKEQEEHSDGIIKKVDDDIALIDEELKKDTLAKYQKENYERKKEAYEVQKESLEKQKEQNNEFFDEMKKNAESYAEDFKFDSYYNIQGMHETIEDTMKVFDALPSGSKHSSLKRVMVTSILLKKMWVLLATMGGIKQFQCPNIQIDTILEEENKFVESSMDFDDVTMDMFYQMKQNLFTDRLEEIHRIKSDNLNDNVSENYNPNKAMQEINQPTIEDYDHELYNFSLPDPLQTLDYVQVNQKIIGKHCDPSFFKQTSFYSFSLVPKNFGFRTKAKIELVQFVHRKSQATEEPDEFNLEISPNDLEDMEEGEQFDKNMQWISQHNILDFDSFNKLKNHMKNLQKEALEEMKKESDGDDKENEEEISFNEINGWNYKFIKFIQGTIQYQNRQFVYYKKGKANIEEAIRFLSDRRALLDFIFNKYKTQKKLSHFRWNVEEDTMKIKALYHFNYTRLQEFLFHELKFSPLATPISVDMIRKSQAIFREFQDYQFYKNVYDESVIRNQDAMIKANMVRADSDDPLPSRSASLPDIGSIINKLSNDKYATLKQKELRIFKSFFELMEQILIQYFSPYVQLQECFRSHPKLALKNKCPTFFRQMLQFIASHPDITINFTEMYNVMNGILTVDPVTMHKYIDVFLNQMFVYAKFELNKLEYYGDAGSLEHMIKFMVKDYMGNQHIPNKVLNLKDIKKKDYLAYVYASTLEDIGYNVPEFKDKYIDFLQRLIKIGEVTNNINDIKKRTKIIQEGLKFEVDKIDPHDLPTDDEERKLLIQFQQIKFNGKTKIKFLI